MTATTIVLMEVMRISYQQVAAIKLLNSIYLLQNVYVIGITLNAL